jgi:hypothetical protein
MPQRPPGPTGNGEEWKYSLESRTNLELKFLDSIAWLLAHGMRNGQTQRTYGRDPAQPKANGRSQVFELDFFSLAKHAAHVKKAVRAQSFVVACPWEWANNFGIEGNFLGATNQ